MGEVPELSTPRLRLRGWQPEDLAPFAALNADPEVMEHFPEPLSRERSDALVERIQAGFGRHGFGLWAVEVTSTAEMIGFTGLSAPAFDAPFQPAVEIGWRLARASWGHGYATEAARAALAFGFGPAGLDQVVSFTAATNIRSQRVMQRIGMTRDPADDFDHPALSAGHRLRRHVLYRLTAAAWRERLRDAPAVSAPGAGES